MEELKSTISKLLNEFSVTSKVLYFMVCFTLLMSFGYLAIVMLIGVEILEIERALPASLCSSTTQPSHSSQRINRLWCSLHMKQYMLRHHHVKAIQYGLETC